MGAEFNPQSPSFTLNEVVKLGLNAHAEFIGEMSSNANKVLDYLLYEIYWEKYYIRTSSMG